jgi:ferredoxin
MKVTVDQDKCVSSGQCVLNAADVFDQRDEDDDAVLVTLVEHVGGVQHALARRHALVLIDENPPAELAGPTRDAAAACPALAIHIEE